MIDPRRLLDVALDASGGDGEATLLLSDRVVARFAHSSLRQTTSLSSGRLSIRCIRDGRAGVASTSRLRESDVVATARLAHELAKFGMTTTAPVTRTQDTPFTAAPPEADSANMAEMLAASFHAAAARDARLFGTVTSTASHYFAANTTGMRRYARFPRADAQIIAVRGSNSGYATHAGLNPSDLDVESLARRAVDGAALLAGDELSLEDGLYDVLLEPPAVAEVLEWLSMIAFTGRSFEDESSPLAGKIGERLWGNRVTIVNDPLAPSFLPSSFDAEGTGARMTPLVEQGIARSVMWDRAGAARNGAEPNGGCPDLGSEEHGIPLHLHLLGGEAARDELMRSSRPLIQVTRFNYVNGLLDTRIAMMTGMTRDGTFLIEGGRPVRRIANARWTQSILEAFSNVEAISRETHVLASWWNPFGGYRVPAMRINGWHFRSGGH